MENDAKIKRAVEGGPSVASPKPPGRVDKMAEAVIECSHVLRQIGLSLEEGPLRVATLEGAARAKAYARSAVYNRSLSGQRRGRRPNRDDKRTMAIQARDGDQDEVGSSSGAIPQAELTPGILKKQT